MAGKFDPKCTLNILEMADMHKLVDDIVKSGQLTQAEAMALKSEMTGRAIKDATGFKKIRAMAAEYVINGYLTAPTNISTNIMSGAGQVFFSPLLREMEAIVGKATANKADQRKMGEGFVMLKGMLQGFSEGMDFAKAGWVTGKPLDLKIDAASFGMTAKEFRDAQVKYGFDDIRGDALKEVLYDQATQAIPGTVGKVLRLGSKAGVAIDEFWKATLRRMEFNAKAYRDADLLAEKLGVSKDEAYAKATENRMNPDNWNSLMRETFGVKGTTDIANFAKEKVFQENLGGLAKVVQELRAKNPLVGALIIPFVKTPYNILKEGAAYMPGIGALARKEVIDPLVGRGTGKFDWALAQPVQRERLIAKQMMGMAATLYVNSLVEEGAITGSSPQGDLPKFSVKIGDSWYSYARIEPLATMFGLVADMHQTYNDYRKDPKWNKETADKIAGHFARETAQSVADNILNKSFVEGIAKVVSAALNPERYGNAFVEAYSTTAIPAGIAAVARGFDPYERQVVGFIDKLKGRIPGLRDTLPVRYDNMGQPVKTSISEVLLGVKVFTPTELQKRLNAVDVDIKGIGKKVGKVDLSAEQLSRYGQLAGGYFSAGLEKSMNSAQWQKLDGFQQEQTVKTILEKSRSAAARQLTGELYKTDPKFATDFYNEYLISKGLQGQVPLK
jgi:hypothetical protein